MEFIELQTNTETPLSTPNQPIIWSPRWRTARYHLPMVKKKLSGYGRINDYIYTGNEYPFENNRETVTSLTSHIWYEIGIFFVE